MRLESAVHDTSPAPDAGPNRPPFSPRPGSAQTAGHVPKNGRDEGGTGQELGHAGCAGQASVRDRGISDHQHIGQYPGRGYFALLAERHGPLPDLGQSNIKRALEHSGKFFTGQSQNSPAGREPVLAITSASPVCPDPQQQHSTKTGVDRA